MLYFTSINIIFEISPVKLFLFGNMQYIWPEAYNSTNGAMTLKAT